MARESRFRMCIYLEQHHYDAHDDVLAMWAQPMRLYMPCVHKVSFQQSHPPKSWLMHKRSWTLRGSQRHLSLPMSLCKPLYEDIIYLFFFWPFRIDLLVTSFNQERSWACPLDKIIAQHQCSMLVSLSYARFCPFKSLSALKYDKHRRKISTNYTFMQSHVHIGWMDGWS